ncbi:MATH domain and coiled-coil domain-containing protein At3g58270-like [Papaver somniferum]|uniref:MATH domain and coiled-coil domain-containing protein At3g58270-like n=1 Tax=Papaver somniferum TaxID=3469 RepID=UPI000E6FD88F|nr:MATH domain and coiled-coil domain-containing protein At3g58270-like [Papaver somniferum]
MHFSDTFSVGCHKWRLLMYPKGAIQGNLSLYLCAVGFSNLPSVDFHLGVINQFDNSYTVRKGAHYKFTALDRARGFTSMMPLNELNGPRKGYIVEDICMVEAEITMPGVPEYQIPTSLEAHNGNLMEVELSVEALAEVVTPTQDIHPVAAPTQTSELTGIMEAVAEVKVSGAANKDKFPGAGRLYEEGRYCKEVIMDEKFEEVGGFRVLKTQASLYKEIWLNYGHIASSQVLKDLYSSQVAIVTEIMTCIVDMYWYRLEEVSSEMIDTWDKKIQVAEKLEFNIGWIRDRLEDIKIKFAGEKKLQDTLMEQDLAKSQVLEAEQQLVLANDRLNMAKERLFGLETKTSPLLLERQNFLKKCGGRLLLFDGVPHAMAPVEKDATAIEEPIDNSNSETVPSTGIAASIPRRTRTLTTSMSPANESKRKSSGDGAGGGNGQPSEKKPKASKDGCAVTLQSISDSPMPSRGSLSPETVSLV